MSTPIVASTDILQLAKQVLSNYSVALAVSAAVLLSLRTMWPSKPRRSNKLPHSEERVVILGASGGMGRSLALKYATTGARVCIFARRELELSKVADECKSQHKDSSTRILFVKGDITVVEDMVNLRAKVQEAWGGLDTLVVCAGVATFRPFCELAGLEARGRTFSPPQADKAAIERAINVVNSVVQTNYIGPSVAAATFIPLLAESMAPSVVLMSSLAAVVPAPTLSLYNASKSASLALYQALAIEHPFIAFTLVLPSTVLGDAFFEAAADGGKPRGTDPNTYGLPHEVVVNRCLDAVDKGEQTVFIPGKGGIAHLMYWIFPSFIAKVARKRYGYPPVN